MTPHQVVLARRCRVPFDEWPVELLLVSVRVSAPLMLSPPLLLMEAVFRSCALGNDTSDTIHLQCSSSPGVCSNATRTGEGDGWHRMCPTYTILRRNPSKLCSAAGLVKAGGQNSNALKPPAG